MPLYNPQGQSFTPTLIGPFPIAFNTPGIGSSEDGALLTALEAGTIVLQHMVVTSIAWEGGSGLGINFGGPDFGAPNDDFGLLGTLYATANLNPGGGNGYKLGLSQSVFGLLESDGALIAQGSGNFTAGASDVYALIVRPA